MKNKITKISELKKVGKRYTVHIRVEEAGKITDKYMRQEGTASDDSGKICFVVWSDSGLPYFEENDEYLLNNVLLFDYKGTYQLQFDKYSSIESKELEKLKNAFLKISEERNSMMMHKYDLSRKEKEIEDSQKHIDMHREQTEESIKYLENKKNEIQQDRFIALFGYLLFLVIIVSGIFYIYDFTTNRIIPKANDVIEVVIKNKNIPYKVVMDDKKRNLITLESMDEYRETICFEGPMNLDKPSKESKEKLKKHVTSEKSRIYTYNIDNNKQPLPHPDYAQKKEQEPVRQKNTQTPQKILKKAIKINNAETTKADKQSATAGDPVSVSKKTASGTAGKKTIYLNSENDDSVLMTLPGIGPHRLKKLKKLRPFYSLEEILDSRIGIGTYWAEKWKEYIQDRKIVFD
ncbi:MAG: hypothetical protein ABIH89_06140 [Elusimicrobiota bacterium]